MGRRTMAAAIITGKCCLLRPSSPFISPPYLRNPASSSLFKAVRSGFQILGLLIYTYEPNDEMENSALNSPNLRGKIPLKKRQSGMP